MLLFWRLNGFNRLSRIPQDPSSVISYALKSFSQSYPSLEAKVEVERIVRIINDHPFPDKPIRPLLLQHIPSPVLSTSFVENVLGRLFASHTNGLKALEFFNFSLQDSQFIPSADAFEKTLHILVRMRYFDKAWKLMAKVRSTHSSLLTHKSMSIVLSKIAKFQSYEDVIEAFEKMENEIFVGWKFGTNEFNALLQVFCTQRQMKEARSVFHKMHSQFSSDTKTMNILLLGFKESGDITSVELFYHEMVKKGFKPNIVTYSIRIDAYCKRGCLSDGLRLLEEMERANISPTLEIITTLIHGAGIARDPLKAQQLFNEIPTRNLCPDTVAYNALMSSLIRCEDVNSAVALMDKMEEKQIEHDFMTYHTMFIGLMRTGLESVSQLYHKMVERNFVPQSRTVVMLMKYFCQNRQIDMGLHFWGYLVDKGFCPDVHALDVLLTVLCSQGYVTEAFECSKQLLKRGRRMSESGFRMLERLLLKEGEIDKLGIVYKMIKKLHTHLPPSIGRTTGTPFSRC